MGATFSSALGNKELDFVAVNDLTNAATLAHLLKYDSILGNLEQDVVATGDGIKVDREEFKVLSLKDPAQLPWKDLGVEVVFESTGLFTNREGAAKHIAAGAKKVIITAPAKAGLLGRARVNERNTTRRPPHLSNASCTTKCSRRLRK